MAKNNKLRKVKRFGFATYVTEEEFLGWQEVPAWNPVRPVIKAGKLDGKAFDYFDKLAPRELDERLSNGFFVLFDTENGKYGKNELVPYYWAREIVVVDTLREPVFRSRYSAVLPVSLAGSVACRALPASLEHARKVEERRNATDGGSAILEMLGIQQSARLSEFKIELEDFMEGDKAENEKMRPLMQAVLGYTRHAPNFPEGLLGAVCDWGSILRGLAMTEEDNAKLKILGVYVNARKSENVPFTFAELASLDGHDADHPQVDFAVVVYLHWKYSSEQLGGNVNWARIADDIAELKKLPLAEEAWSWAVWMIGSMAGFKSFSAQYHAFKRDELANAKNAKMLVKSGDTTLQ